MEMLDGCRTNDCPRNRVSTGDIEPLVLGAQTLLLHPPVWDDPVYSRQQRVSACAAGVVTRTTNRDSSRYPYNGIRRVRQLALGCESN